MEHPEALGAGSRAVVVGDQDGSLDDIAEIVALFDGTAQEAPPQRTLWQVLVVVVGWVIVIVIAAVALVVAAPAIQALVVGIVRATLPGGSAS
jgi:hypothetical protein